MKPLIDTVPIKKKGRDLKVGEYVKFHPGLGGWIHKIQPAGPMWADDRINVIYRWYGWDNDVAGEHLYQVFPDQEYDVIDL